MEKIKIAFATNNNQLLTKEHFGEANEYLIYDVSKTNAILLEIVKNISPEEKMHGDPNKAKGVASILKPLGVKVLVNKAFGRNISRMQQKFVVIVAKNDDILLEIKNIQINFEKIISEYKKGETRDYLKL